MHGFKTRPAPLRQALRRCTSGAVVVGVLSTLLTLVTAGVSSAGTSSCSDNGITVTSLNAPVFYIDSTGVPQLHAGYVGYQVTSTTARHHLFVELSDFTGGGVGLAPVQSAYVPLGAMGAGGHASAFFLLTAAGASSTAQSHSVSVFSDLPVDADVAPLCTTTGSFAGVEETAPAADNQLRAWPDDSDPAVTVSGDAQQGGTLTVTVDGTTGALGEGSDNDPRGFSMTPSALSDFPANRFRLVSTSLLISPDGTSPKQTYDDVLHLATTGDAGRDYRATYTFLAVAPTSETTPLFPVQDISSGSETRHTVTTDHASLAALPIIGHPLTVDLDADPAQLDASGGTTTITQTFASTSSVSSSLDLLYAALPQGATYIPGSAAVGGSPVDDPLVSEGVMLFYGPYEASSGAPLTLTFDVSLVASNTTYTFIGLGVLLPSGIVGSTRSGSLNYAYTRVTVGTPPVPQTITFPPLADVYVDEAGPALAATADSSLPVAYSSQSPSVCTVADGIVTPVAVGTCTLQADQAGDDTHEAASPVSQSFDVLAEPQSITAPGLTDVPLDGVPATLTPTATSTLPVTWTTSTPQTCVVVDGRVQLVATGTCTLVGSQAGDATYAPAADVTVGFEVLPPAAPVPDAAAGATVGTAPSRISVPDLPSGTVLSVDPGDVAATSGLRSATVSGSSVVLVADPDFSGLLTLPVTATRGGTSSTITLTLVVSPPAAARPSARPLSAGRSLVGWRRSPSAQRYQVTLGGRVLCATTGLSCTVRRLLGPATRPRVVALGGAGTRSTPTVAAPRLSGRVVLTRVFFPALRTGLTPVDRLSLRHAARLVVRNGFRHVLVVGRTHDQLMQGANARLARLRAVATATYLRRVLAPHGVQVRVSTRGKRHFGGSAAGRAHERRADVYLS